MIDFQEVRTIFEQKAIEYLDLRFTDLLGTTRHVTLTARDVAGGDDLYASVEPSLLPAMESMNPSRLVVRPVFLLRGLDPFSQFATVGALGELCDANGTASHPGDPRGIAGRAEAALRAAGVADQALFASELQFFVFDKVVFDQGMHAARYEADSREGVWRRGRDEPDNLGLQIRHGDGYGQMLPQDSLMNLRAEMAQAIDHFGVEVASHARAAASAAQMSIRLRPMPLVAAADAIQIARYVIRNVAARHGKVATFMPKPILGDPGSALRIELQLHKSGRSLLQLDAQGRPSGAGAHVVGGLRAHAAALTALACPTTNSYRRLAQDDFAPRDDSFGFDHPTAMICWMRSAKPQTAHRLSLNLADGACNPYLFFAALAMAMVDGMAQRAVPGAPQSEEDADMARGDEIVELDGASARSAAPLPRTLETALRALWDDRGFLERDAVFSAQTLAGLISWKSEMEVRALQMRPHPYEFCLYFNS